MRLPRFATNKNGALRVSDASDRGPLRLGLDEASIKELMPHLGRHPKASHEFVLVAMQLASREAGGDKTKVLERLRS
jgi:hypothetical protein